VIAYASRTGTRKNLEALRRAGWRLLVSATGSWRNEGFAYAIDNGAWTAHQSGLPFDEARFMRLVWKMGEKADWIAVPDIVTGGIQSLEFSLKWLPELRGIAPLLLPVQDGIRPRDIRAYVGPELGIFIGGSTEWKIQTALFWGDLARDRKAHLHMGRVNSQRRIRIAQAAGCHSFDGTSVSRYAVTLHELDPARRQEALCFC